jgi:hypothetical protein
MSSMMDILKALPEMKSGEELIEELSVLPEYDVAISKASQAVRLMALSELYNIYVPSRMSLEIYSKLYLALLRSMQKKGTKLAIQQQYQNNKAIRQQEYSGIMGGSDSFTIIGTSGIGKSSAISRAISLITENRIFELENPYARVIPCVIVQCPWDSSVKGLLLEILRKVDEVLESNYYQNAIRARATTDMLIGSVSQVALNHIGLLICDEIQNVVNSRNGKNLIGSLTQLINNSGISICMVGTPESTVFFEQAMQLARRSLGLQYDAMKYDTEFVEFCKILFSYQYVNQRTEITDAIVEWLYEHSSGNVSVVVALIHDAQEIAILSGKETLDLEVLNEAYEKRLSLLHEYIQPTIVQKNQTSRTKKEETAASVVVAENKEIQIACSIADLVAEAKKSKTDVVELLKVNFQIVEVSI